MPFPFDRNRRDPIRPGILIAWLAGASLLLLTGCRATPWNNPYPVSDRGENILYSSFAERPKYLDPARAYSSNEYEFIANIYSPPLQYHYLKRPYQLVPLTAEQMPDTVYLDTAGKVLPDGADDAEIHRTVYRIRIRPGIRYQPHPAFATDGSGNYRYHRLTQEDLSGRFTLSDFAHTGTRELVAEDYIYQIKRLAHPAVHSPIFGHMSEYIIGLAGLRNELIAAYQQLVAEQGEDAYLDLTQFALSGVRKVDRYTYEIEVAGKYPQFVFWLAMPFFSPMPWEAVRFYSNPGMRERNITLNWYPVGTGPYMLSENNPNLRMTLSRNPHFAGELYPSEGSEGDVEAGYLKDAGRPLPFIDHAVFSLEKEAIPYWNKFLQGYYDVSAVPSDSFDKAVQFNAQGEASLTEEMKEKGIRLITAVTASISYIGFNMLDDKVGGYSDRARKLRQAISIAVDYEEYISIFLNGRGVPAQGIVPPGIFGHREGQPGINDVVYQWQAGRARRRDIEVAQRLMSEAGYPGGINPDTGSPLILHFDTPQAGPGTKAYFDWLRKQFRKIGIQLVPRPTDYNRFQEKMLTGTAEIFQWGWNADYPDPENFMFLLYGPNAKVGHNGENASNYHNEEFDGLFERMKNMDNGLQRQAVIDRMLAIARADAPWLWGFHPVGFSLYHRWYREAKPNLMANNTLKYKRIDPALRARLRAAWNRPVLMPVVVAFALLVLSAVPAVVSYRRRERAVAR